MAQFAFIGGTGREGLGLAARFALAGERVIIGSRDPERARHAAEMLRQRVAAAGRTAPVSAAENQAAAAEADHVVLAVPFAAVETTLAGLAPSLAGKIVLDVINPLIFRSGVFTVAALPAGSAGELIQQLLPRSLVVSGFKHLSAKELCQIERPLRGDVLLCSETPAATQQLMQVISRIPSLRAVDVGALANARHLESLTALLLGLNRRYRVITSIQVLGLTAPLGTSPPDPS